jgi:hypothetical protein
MQSKWFPNSDESPGRATSCFPTTPIKDYAMPLLWQRPRLGKCHLFSKIR